MSEDGVHVQDTVGDKQVSHNAMTRQSTDTHKHTNRVGNHTKGENQGLEQSKVKTFYLSISCPFPFFSPSPPTLSLYSSSHSSSSLRIHSLSLARRS